MFGLINRDTLPTPTKDEFEHLVAGLKALWLVEHNEDGTHLVRQDTDSVPIGGMMMWPGATVPTANWEFCRGQQLSRTTYKALFDLIGTTYGIGDGSTTFNIPDLQQRFPLGKAAAGTGSTVGATGGAIDHTHASGALSGSTGASGALAVSGNTGDESAHTHSGTAGPTSVGETIVVAAGVGASVAIDFHTHPVTTGAGSAHHHDSGSLTAATHTHGAGTLAMAATGTANPPYLVVNYIILAK